jgi:hypothetical protein
VRMFVCLNAVTTCDRTLATEHTRVKGAASIALVCVSGWRPQHTSMLSSLAKKLHYEAAKETAAVR